MRGERKLVRGGSVGWGFRGGGRGRGGGGGGDVGRWRGLVRRRADTRDGCSIFLWGRG